MLRIQKTLFFLGVILTFSLLLLSSCKRKSQLLAEAEINKKEAEMEALFRKVPRIKNSENLLINLVVQGQIDHMKIDGKKDDYDTVRITIEQRLYLASGNMLQINTIEVSSGATATPTMGDANDYTKPVEIKVTAENGQQRTYVVVATYTNKKGNDILRFVLQGQNTRKYPTRITAHPDKKNDSIIIYIDEDKYCHQDLNLDILQISPKAKIDKGQGQKQNYGSPVKYTLTSQDGEQHEYTVYAYLLAQMPNKNFSEWTEYQTGGHRLVNGRAQTHYYYNPQYYSTYNQGFWFTIGNGTNFPVRHITVNGKKIARLESSTYQNSATSGKNYTYGISPGMLFTGSLTDFDNGPSYVSSRNYKRGKPQYSSITFGCDKLLRKNPKSFSITYSYIPKNNLVEPTERSQSSCCGWIPSTYNYQKTVASKNDTMECFLVFVNNANKIIAVGGMSSNQNASNTTQTISLKYQNRNCNKAENDATRYVAKSGWESGSNKNITKVYAVFTASSNVFGAKPIGASGSILDLFNITINY